MDEGEVEKNYAELKNNIAEPQILCFNRYPDLNYHFRITHGISTEATNEFHTLNVVVINICELFRMRVLYVL